MLDAIDTAEHCVCLETYIFMADAVGERFIDALVRAARRGVTICVIIESPLIYS
jgi:cardiolipin synthase